MWGRDPETGLLCHRRSTGNHIKDPELKATEFAFSHFSDRETYEPFPRYDFDPKERLTTPPPTPDKTCANLKDRENYWVLLRYPDKVVSPEWPFLNRVASICKAAGIYLCENEGCAKNRENLVKVVPQCEWDGLREWIISTVACQLSLEPSQRVTEQFFHLAAGIILLYRLLHEYKEKSVRYSGGYTRKDGVVGALEVVGVIEVIYWAIVVQSHTMRMSTIILDRWAQDLVPIGVTSLAAEKATSEAKNLGICQNRLWNLALVSERKELDLPPLMELAALNPGLKHKGHGKCLAGSCTMSSVDSTRLKQLHKCDGQHNPEAAAKCLQNKLFFDPGKLNTSIVAGGTTVWSTEEPFEISQKPYVAISHVWSDGTGIGLGVVGEVNRCLFEYFATLIKDIGYEAIWWDTISIPTDPVARRKAINEMHKNYELAEYTLLHDDYLVNFEWADDGSPAWWSGTCDKGSRYGCASTRSQSLFSGSLDCVRDTTAPTTAD
ncbi:hypothetical protein ABW20_dc0100242 [Dactylellina cionopaga]|nr:hypothetical protein ABW20_dc0100242 [Dactylellina cionopaga]